jgi:hypothetical protein
MSGNWRQATPAGSCLSMEGLGHGEDEAGCKACGMVNEPAGEGNESDGGAAPRRGERQPPRGSDAGEPALRLDRPMGRTSRAREPLGPAVRRGAGLRCSSEMTDHAGAPMSCGSAGPNVGHDRRPAGKRSLPEDVRSMEW